MGNIILEALHFFCFCDLGGDGARHRKLSVLETRGVLYEDAELPRRDKLCSCWSVDGGINELPCYIPRSMDSPYPLRRTG